MVPLITRVVLLVVAVCCIVGGHGGVFVAMGKAVGHAHGRHDQQQQLQQEVNSFASTRFRGLQGETKRYSVVRSGPLDSSLQEALNKDSGLYLGAVVEVVGAATTGDVQVRNLSPIRRYLPIQFDDSTQARGHVKLDTEHTRFGIFNSDGHWVYEAVPSNKSLIIIKSGSTFTAKVGLNAEKDVKFKAQWLQNKDGQGPARLTIPTKQILIPTTAHIQPINQYEYDSTSFPVIVPSLSAFQVWTLLSAAFSDKSLVQKFMCASFFESRWSLGARLVNKNKSFDIGLMQINSVNWLDDGKCKTDWKTNADCKEKFIELQSADKSVAAAQKIYKTLGLGAWYAYRGHCQDPQSWSSVKAFLGPQDDSTVTYDTYLEKYRIDSVTNNLVLF